MNELFRKQQELQDLYLLSTDDSIMHVGQLCDKIRNTAFFLNQEVVELIEEIAGSADINKPWKTGHNSAWLKKVDITDKVRSEAIDVLKFAMNICLFAGITPENVEDEFNKVNERCIRRYNDDY